MLSRAELLDEVDTEDDADDLHDVDEPGFTVEAYPENTLNSDLDPAADDTLDVVLRLELLLDRVDPASDEVIRRAAVGADAVAIALALQLAHLSTMRSCRGARATAWYVHELAYAAGDQLVDVNLPCWCVVKRRIQVDAANWEDRLTAHNKQEPPGTPAPTTVGR